MLKGDLKRINPQDIQTQLKQERSDYWIAVEILPKPDPDTAAQQAADYLTPLIEKYNIEVLNRWRNCLACRRTQFPNLHRAK